MKKQYLVTGRQPWNRSHFDELLACLPGTWTFVSTPPELAEYWAKGSKPRYAFFLHWSDKVTNNMLAEWECVCFHMTDVPYGRGGSPLQNLIIRGHRETKLTALRMTEQFDAGPVYTKRNLSLEGSSAEEVYIRASRLSCEIIQEIVRDEPPKIPQDGEVTIFHRRKSSDSKIPDDQQTLGEIHDFIRMLDAEGYPKAFLRLGKFKIEFSRSALYHGCVKTDATISNDDSCQD